MLERRGLRRQGLRGAAYGKAYGRSGATGRELVNRFQEPAARSNHRAGGQVHSTARRVSLRRARRSSTAASLIAPACISSGFRPTTSPRTARIWMRSSRACTASSCPAASAIAASRARNWPRQYAREHGVPYLGICLGMQIAVIEFARDVLGLKAANSTEFDPQTPDPVIDLMDDQKGLEQTGGTMRLGGYDCKLLDGTASRALYGREMIVERHRHRYEFNNKYKEALENSGSESGRRESRTRSGGNRRAGGASVVRRLSVPSGVQVPSQPPASAVFRFCRRGH